MKTKPSKRGTATFLFLFLIGCLLLLPVTVGFAQTSPVNSTAFPHVQDEILVRFKSGVARNAMASVHASMGAQVLKSFRIVERLQRVKLPHGVSVDEALEMYRQRPDVLYAEPNYIVEALIISNDPSFTSLWGLQNTGQAGGALDADIDAPDAWNVTTGSSSVVVAVIDTGIDYNHQDLSANVFRNAADCNHNGIDDDGNGFVDDCFGIDAANNDSDPMDDHSHGTHVAGTIGAAGNNGVGVVGVNWNVKIMACKFISAAGFGFISDAIDCLNYIAMMKDRGVNIIATSNSWGGGGFSQALLDAIDAHRQRGILFIAAAGNATADNDSALFYPANYYLPNVISVAATDRLDGLAYFSNYGRRSVHLGAPGHQILSTVPGNQYAIFSGTSMATPHVTGVAALLKAQDPGRDWRAIKNLILAGGDGIPSMANTIAQKRLNAFGALTCSNSTVFSRLRPIEDTLLGSVGTPINLAALNINCADPNGNVAVVVNPGGEVVTLLDDGMGVDQAAGDGIYSGQFIPAPSENYTLTFPDGDVVTVTLAPLISVTPSSQDFGSVAVGASADRSFFVLNLGAGTLSGSASTSAPFSIVAGGSYNLGPGEGQAVTVRFSPPSAGAFSGTIDFTGAGGTSATVTGAGVVCSTASIAFGETRSGALSNTDCPAPHRPWSFADLYTFSGVAGQQIRITMNSTWLYSVLFLLGPSGDVVAYDDDCPWASHETCIPWNAMTGGSFTLPRSGTYTIEATSWFSDVIGNYSVYLTLANGPQRLTVTKTGSGTGTVVSDLSGINCGNDCAADFNGGWAVQLIARPSPDSIFAGWSGACSGTSICFLTMATKKSVTAAFTKLIDVTAPRGGESWTIGGKQTIQWNSTWITGNVKIDLSRDGGLSWRPISKNTTNDGSQSWKVTKPATTRARIRICSVKFPWICGTSDADFAIR